MIDPFIISTVLWCAAVAVILLVISLIMTAPKRVQREPMGDLPPQHYNCRCTITPLRKD